MDVLDAAYDEGIRTFMCTTHDRIAEVCDHVRAAPGALPGLHASIPCMPYAHKYANAVTEDGMLGAMRQLPPGHRVSRRRAARDVLAGPQGHRRPDHAAGRCRDEDVRGSAHAGDLAAERRRRPAARASASTTPSGSSPITSVRKLRRRARLHHHEPADAARHAGRASAIENPIVCSNINKIGFRMSGGIEAYRRALEQHDVPRRRHVGVRLGRHPAATRRSRGSASSPTSSRSSSAPPAAATSAAPVSWSTATGPGSC